MGDPLYPWDRKQESQQDEREARLIAMMIDEWYFHADENVKAKLSDFSRVLLDRAAQQVQADEGAVDIDAAERAAFESTNDSDNVAMYKHWFRKGFKAGSARPAAESDKRECGDCNAPLRTGQVCGCALYPEKSDARAAARWRLAAATWKVFRVEVVPGVVLSHPKGIPFEDLATQADAAMSREQSQVGGGAQ